MATAALRMLTPESTHTVTEKARPVMPLSFRSRSRTPGKGQSLVEFGILLPILAGLVGATVDLARMYEQRVKLEAATRDAAEYVATDTTVTTADQARTKATTLICAQFGLSSTCTSPSVTIVSYSRSSADPGSPEFPQVSVTVSSTLGFSTLVPWPFVSTNWRSPYANGGGPSSGGAQVYQATLTASKSFVILQGR